jgi:hypothetical protein
MEKVNSLGAGIALASQPLSGGLFVWRTKMDTTLDARDAGEAAAG